MVDRNLYLKMCQKCAVLPDGIMGIKQDVPKELRVVHNEIEYYPFGYTLYFDNQGNPCHCAILHDLKANSITHASLKNVEILDIDKTN
jgi:hypothetical protein